MVIDRQEEIYKENTVEFIRLFTIDSNMNLRVDRREFNNFTEIKTVTLKYARKAITFTVNSSVDDVKEI